MKTINTSKCELVLFPDEVKGMKLEKGELCKVIIYNPDPANKSANTKHKNRNNGRKIN